MAGALIIYYYCTRKSKVGNTRPSHQGVGPSHCLQRLLLIITNQMEKESSVDKHICKQVCNQEASGMVVANDD